MQVRQVGTMPERGTMGNLLRKGFPIPLQTFLKTGMVKNQKRHTEVYLFWCRSYDLFSQVNNKFFVLVSIFVRKLECKR